MRVLLTGAAGFIGRCVHAQLLARGHTVQGVDAYLPQVHGVGLRERLAGVGDIFASSVRNHAVQWGKDPNEVYDAVIHLAAEVGVGQSQYEPLRYVEANVSETAALWEAILRHHDHAEVRKVVVASSMSVYGEGEYDYSVKLPRPTRETKTPEPASVYAQSKYDTERYSVILGKAYGIPTIALRFFNTVGAGQAINNGYTGCVMNFLSRAINGQPPMVTEDGMQSRDFVHVSDVARAVVMAVEKDGVSGVFNVGTGAQTTVGDVARWVCEEVARGGGASVEPQILGKYREGDVRHCFADATLIGETLGWRADKSARDAVGDAVRWAMAAVGRGEVELADNMPHVFRELEERGLLREA